MLLDEFANSSEYMNESLSKSTSWLRADCDHGNAIVGNALSNPMMARSDFPYTTLPDGRRTTRRLLSAEPCAATISPKRFTPSCRFHVRQHDGEHSIFGKAIFHIGVETSERDRLPARFR